MKRSYTLNVLLFALVVSIHLHAQTGPGGVGKTDGTSTLKLWLKADAGTSTTTNGAGVSAWNDQSGAGYNAAQATSGNQPTYTTSSVNGQPALTFNGSSSYMLVNSFPLFTTNTSPISMFVVFKPTDVSSQRFVLHQPQTNCSNNFELGYHTGYGSTSNWGLHAGCGYAAVADNAANTAYNIMTLKVLASGTTPSNVKIRKNGSDLTIVNNGNGWASAGNYGTTSGRKLIIGARDDNNNNSYNSWHTGTIAEIIYMDQNLNSAQTNLVENYLNAKYNISISADKYAQPSATTYIKKVAGIGKESDGTSTSASSDGLILTNGSFLTDNGDYMMFGYDNTATTTTTSDLPSSVLTRWTRDWFIDKTDVGTSNGNVTLTFDFSDMGIGGTPFGVYSLLFRSTNSGSYSTITANASISGDQVSFTVDASLLADGYYTLGIGTTPFGNALNLDGVNASQDYVVIADNSNLRLSGGSFTVEFWAKPSALSGWVISKDYSNSTGQLDYLIGINGTQWRFIARDLAIDISAGPTLSVGNWYHVACTFDGTTATLYVNGVAVGTDTSVGSSSTSNANVLLGGRVSNNPAQFYSGSLDELRIWNVARSQSEIQANMYSYYTGATTNLKAYFRFDQGNAAGTNTGLNKVVDYSGNCNTGTLTNFALSGSTSNWVSSGTAKAPILATTAASSIAVTTATLNGNMFATGETSATTRGFQLSTSSCMTSPVEFSETGTFSSGTYSLSATGLFHNTTYYFRAYATNAQGTTYGETLSFTTPAFTSLGNALNFDGSDDFVVSPDLGYTVKQKSFSAWVKLNNVSQQGGGLISYEVNDGSIFDAIVYNETNNGWGFGSNGFSRTVWSGVKETSTSEWVHIAATYTDNEYKLYRNGVLILSTASFGAYNYPTNSRILVGKRHTGGGSPYLNAQIDEVRVWNKVLTQSEIQANMYSYYTGATTNLKAYYRFDQGYDAGTNTGLNKVVDYSGNCNTGTLTNFALSGSTSNWVATGNAEAPIVTISAASSVSASATLNGNILSSGESSVTTRGFCYATSSCPTISNSVVNQTGTFSTGTYSLNAVGLLPLTTYYARPYATNAQGTSYGEEISFTTLATPTWSGGAWSSTPTASDNVVINDTYNAAGISCNNLTVNAGKRVTITSGTMAIAGNLVLKSDVNGTATLINNGTLTVNGTTTAEQYLSTTRNWYVSSPVSQAAAPSGYTYYLRNEATASWTPVNAGTLFTPGVGYIALPTSAGSTITFTGTLNSGNVTIPLTVSGESSTGYNLIGNPYPSHLTWTKTFTDAHNALIEPTIWYRTNTGSWTFHTYNAYSDMAVPEGVTGIVPPMQAFWVKAKTAGNLILDNTLTLSHQTSNPLKVRSDVKNTIPKLRLQVSNGSSTDETLIYFNPLASNNFDNYDSRKMSNTNVSIPEIYTIAGSERLVINGLNSSSLFSELPLGFTTGNSNSFTIKATEFSNFDTNTMVILKDNYLGIEQDLTVGNYTFTSDVTTTANRFSIVFKITGTTGIKNETGNTSAYVYPTSNNQITIQLDEIADSDAKMAIYNGLGQKIESKQLTGRFITTEKSFTPGVYLVVLTNKNKAENHKITIR